MTPPRVDSDKSIASARAEEIRETAGALFLAKGYASTTMNDIARAVGILPGSLYHHFVSKEAVAVEILDSFNDELQVLSVRLRSSVKLPPEERLRELCLAVAKLSLRHSAAVRLRAFDPPTVASNRFRAAIGYQPVGLQRLWRAAAVDLRGEFPDSQLDPGLLTHTLQVLTVTMSTSLATPIDPKASSDLFCDALLHGIVIECPGDSELEASRPLACARDEISSWKTSPSVDAITFQILDGARREFARRGFHATTIRDVAEASGVRMGTIYRRVSSMEAIFREIAQNYADQLDHAARAVLLTEPTDVAGTLDALAHVITQAKRRFRDETRMMSLGWNTALAEQGPFQSEYRRLVTERMNLLTDVLGEGQARGHIVSTRTAEELAPHLRNILWVHLADHGRTSGKQEQRFLRSHLMRGVVAR